MKSSLRLWLLGILLLAATSCARQGHDAAVASGCQDGMMSEAQASQLSEQIDTELIETQLEEEGPILEALTREFFELREQDALVDSAQDENMESVTFYKASDPETADSLVAWLKKTGHDMSEEQACEGLYLALEKRQLGCRRLTYFFASGRQASSCCPHTVRAEMLG